MNKIRVYCLLVIYTILFTINGWSAGDQDIISDINTSFSKGSVEHIKNHLSNNVDLSFNQQKSIYSKSQAVVILKQQLDKEPPTYYKLLKHSNPNNKNIIFLISDYRSAKNKYIIYLSLKLENNDYKITEIHFESQ